MKKSNLVLIVFMLGVILFNSCEEGLTVDVNTSLKKNITVDINDGRKSTDSGNYAFFVIDTLDIDDNEDLQKNIDKIKDLKISKATCKLTGIPDGESIPELNVIIPEALFSATLTNITDNNMLFTLDVTPEVLDFAAKYLYDNHKFTIQVSGFSTYAPMQLGVQLEFETKLTTSL